MGLLCLPISTLKAQSKVVESPPGTDLVYQPGIPGQEGASSSARRGEAAPVVIYGEISDYGEVGEVTLQFWPILFDASLQNPGPEVQRITPYRNNIFQTFVPAFDRQFLFKIPEVTSPGYIRLEVDNYRYLDTYLIMPGDSIMVRVDRTSNSTVFTGPSAPLFRCQQELEMLALERKLDRPKNFQLGFLSSLTPSQKSMMETSEKEFGRKAKAVRFGTDLLAHLESQLGSFGDEDYLEILERYRNSFGDSPFQILKANALSGERLRVVNSFYRYAYPTALKHGDNVLTGKYEEFFRDKLSEIDIPLGFATEYIYAPSYIKLRNAILLAQTKITGQDYLELADNVIEQALRSKMVTGYFLDKVTVLNTGDVEMKSGLELVVTEPYKSILSTHMNRHLKGSEVPDFTLENSSGEEVSLGDFRGKAILLDFYLSGCKACLAFSDEMKKIAQNLGKKDDVIILSISVDRDRSVWEKSLASGKYSVPGSIDLYTQGLGHEHPLTSFYGISLVPHLMLIAPDGSLLKSGFYPMGYDRIIPELSSLLGMDATSSPTESNHP